MVTVPNFDLLFRYFDIRSADGTSRDLCKVQYRLGDSNIERGSNQHFLLPAAAPTGNLVCDFDRKFIQDLHRRSWIRQQNALLPSVDEVGWRDRLRKLREDYAKAFP